MHLSAEPVATLDLPLNIGLSFSMNGRIKRKSAPACYVSWTGAILTFSVDDVDTGAAITELAASSDGVSPLIIISGPDDTVFSLKIPPTATTGLDFREGLYALKVEWPSGEKYPVITGVLTPKKIAGVS